MITSARPMFYAASLHRWRPVVRQTAVRVSEASLGNNYSALHAR
jgi:hypothetical protein